MAGAAAASTPKELANLLIAAGLVTQFQSEQFLQGRWRGFTIGKYRVLERLGSGGMGTVYLCEHLQVGRKVAVKVLPTSQASNPSALGRFYREARAAGVLDHPNLVKAHDIDQDGGLHFLVMDYVDGDSLQHIVARFGPLPVERAAPYISQAAQGLQHAHQIGWLHRDVKPANIMLERNGTIRVLDLGLARFFYDNNDPLTLQHDADNVLGTADYLSPEQALNSHDVDVRTDVYSLGATFYFLLTGRAPFPDGKIAQKLIWHQVRQPTPVRQLRPEVPEGVAAILEKMMAKNPAQRYQTPAEVIEALAPWVSETIAPPREEEIPRLSPLVESSPSPTPAPQRARRAAEPMPARRSTTSTPLPLPAGDSSGRLGLLHRSPSIAEVATPAVLSSKQTETDAAKPFTPPTMAPGRWATSHQPQAAPAPAPVEPASGGRTTLMGLVMVLASGVIGVLLTWWFMGQ